MKKINVLTIVIFSIALSIFTSCDPAETVEPTPGTLSEYSDVKLVFSTLSLTEADMLNIDDGSTLNAEGNVADMDIAYCWEDNAVHSIVAPNSAWLASLWEKNGINYDVSNKNATKLGKVDIDFENITVEDITNISVNAGTDVKNLNIGDVVAFETVDGVKGFLEINIKKVTTSIYLNVKYLKPSIK
jgi:uncharacterized lipoprotein YehR (DUF1307 family)